MNTHTTQKGVTLMEIMLVIGILVLTLGFSVLLSQTSQIRSDVNAEAAKIVGLLRVLRGNASSGSTTEPMGMHLTNNSYTTFSGASFAENDPSNTEYILSGPLAIQNITLNTGGSDIIFSAPDGRPQNFGTFELISSQISKTITITINSLGTISYQ